MINVKEVNIHTYATPIACVVCEETVDLREEDRLRKMLCHYYEREKPEFSRVAIQILGSVILFRVMPNCKRSPNKEDVGVILRALNLVNGPVPKLAAKKRPSPQPAARREARTI